MKSLLSKIKNLIVTIFRIDNLMSSISPLYFTSRVLGMPPISLEEGSNVSDTCFNLVYGFTTGSFIIFLCLRHLYDYWYHVYNVHTKNYIISDMCSKILLYGTAALSVFKSNLYRKLFSDLMKKVLVVDRKLVRNNKVYFYMYWILMFQLLASSAMILGTYKLIDYAWGSNGNIFFLYEASVHIIGLIFLLQFVNMLLYIRYLYKTLNKKLYSFVQVDSEELTHEKTRHFLIVYKELQEILELVSSYFSWQIVCETSSLFIQLVSSEYATVHEIRLFFVCSYSCFVHYFRILTQVLLFVYYSSVLLAICVSGHICTRECNTTLNVIHKLLLNSKIEEEICKELHGFTMYYYMHRIQITANNIFPIDMTLFQMVNSVVFVYLAILLEI